MVIVVGGHSLYNIHINVPGTRSPEVGHPLSSNAVFN